jgi:uncharacterized protein (DUF934 family)
MPQLIRGRAPVTDDWALAGPESAVDSARLILPLADYLKEMANGAAPASRAVLLKPEDHDLESLLPYVAQLPLVAVHFGSTGEGRGYSQARLLRERYGYRGELRAVGKIRADQMYFLGRCGFDAFELLEGEDVVTAIAQLDRFSVAYQPDMPERLTHPRWRHAAR